MSNARVRSDGVDRSANVIFFGLPESSLIDSKELVDEISNFLTGSALGVKDLRRIGKSSEKRSRPTLVKLCSVWDKRLLLASKSKLKNFRLQSIFVCQDMSKEECLAVTARRRLVAPPLGKKTVLPLALFLLPLLHFLLPPTPLEFLRTCLDLTIIIDGFCTSTPSGFL